MKVKLIKKVDLSEYGKEWEGCYLDFLSPSFEVIKPLLEVGEEKDQQKATEKVFVVLGELFVGGKVVTDEGVKDITKDDLSILPIELINKSVTLLAGTPSPK